MAPWDSDFLFEIEIIYITITHILIAPGIFDSVFNMGCFQILMVPGESSKSWQYYRLIQWIKNVCHMLDFFPLQGD